MTPSEIEPATCRLVAQCLNQLRHHVPPSSYTDILCFCDAVRTDVRKCMASEYSFDVISKDIKILTRSVTSARSVCGSPFPAINAPEDPMHRLHPGTCCCQHPVRFHGTFVSIFSLVLVTDVWAYLRPFSQTFRLLENVCREGLHRTASQSENGLVEFTDGQTDAVSK
jgi:hypothetical protein